MYMPHVYDSWTSSPNSANALVHETVKNNQISTENEKNDEFAYHQVV